jgi:hypothetical protein
MEFDQLKSALKSLAFDSTRLDCDNQFEGVILREEIEKLTARLEKFFGSPAWPSENTLSLDARQTINYFGGVMPGQTLYYWSQGEDSVFAMLWPWKDGQRTTVKVVKKV